MKKALCSIFTLFISIMLYSEPRVKVYSKFKIQGEFELRNECDFDKPVIYRTLNLEGGMRLTVLEIGETDTHNGENGVWLKVMTTAPMWVDNGDLIEKLTTFWLFFTDSITPINYEEPGF